MEHLRARHLSGPVGLRAHYSYLQPGHYVFNLTGGRFDTRKLRDGVYDVVVTAQDIAGHSDVESLRFTVHNAPGWAGKP